MRCAAAPVVLATLIGAAPPGPMAATTQAYTITNAHGMTVRFLDLGGTITAVEVPDRQGHRANVVLGYGSGADYAAKNWKNDFGATIGRYAGRIAGAAFTIDGQDYRLSPNDGPNALHGGRVIGLLGRSFTVTQTGRDAATLQYASADGDQGFPGTLTLRVRYRVMPDDTFRIDYDARTTKPTVLNLTNHSYFNLGGQGSGPVTDERLTIHATRWVEAGGNGIPTGRLAPVAGTPLDFRTPHAIGERIDAKTPEMGPRGGYNHAWFFDKPAGELAPVLVLEDATSGRRLTVATTEPSMQAYTGEYIDGRDVDAGGHVIHPRDGIALEMQHPSDAPHQPAFPTTLLRPGQVYRATTTWRFDAGAAR
jgi:aldose 1-epimerase